MSRIRMSTSDGDLEAVAATDATIEDVLSELTRLRGARGRALKLTDEDGVELAVFPVDTDGFLVRLRGKDEEPWAAHDTSTGGGDNFEPIIEGRVVMLRAPWRLTQDRAAQVLADYFAGERSGRVAWSTMNVPRTPAGTHGTAPIPIDQLPAAVWAQLVERQARLPIAWVHSRLDWYAVSGNDQRAVWRLADRHRLTDDERYSL